MKEKIRFVTENEEILTVNADDIILKAFLEDDVDEETNEPFQYLAYKIVHLFGRTEEEYEVSEEVYEAVTELISSNVKFAGTEAPSDDTIKEVISECLKKIIPSPEEMEKLSTEYMIDNKIKEIITAAEKLLARRGYDPTKISVPFVEEWKNRIKIIWKGMKDDKEARDNHEKEQKKLAEEAEKKKKELDLANSLPVAP